MNTKVRNLASPRKSDCFVDLGPGPLSTGMYMSTSRRPSLIGTYALLCFALSVSGCTHKFLKHNTTAQVASLNDLLHEQVLDNIAMFECNAGSMPAFSMPSTNTAQCTDNHQGTLSLTWNPTTLITELMTLNAQRSLMENWAMAPVVDATKLKRLRCGFQLVTQGFALDYCHVDPSMDPSASPSYPWRVASCDNGSCTRCLRELINVGLIKGPPKEKVAKGSLDFCCEIDAQSYIEVLRLELACKLPNCWYHVGRKCDVPRAASYVGHYDQTYVWVEPDCVDALSRATISLMDLATRNSPSGDAVTIRRRTGQGNDFVEYTGTVPGNIRDAEFQATAQARSELQKRIDRLRDEAQRLDDLDKRREKDNEATELEKIRNSLDPIIEPDDQAAPPTYDIQRFLPYTPYTPGT
jgi:hypothetical protein